MGDAGEGLVDAEGRIQERMEELARERAQKPAGVVVTDPALRRMAESLRLARTEIVRQWNVTTNPGRKAQLTRAMEDIDRRIADTQR